MTWPSEKWTEFWKVGGLRLAVSTWRYPIAIPTMLTLS